MFLEIPKDLEEDPWFKVVEFLQQNWAVILNTGTGSLVVFYGDTCGVFDEIAFETEQDAEEALKRNGFRKYREDPQAAEFITIPKGEFHQRPHPNGRIYSDGRFWI